jgi:hypothetical protein
MHRPVSRGQPGWPVAHLQAPEPVLAEEQVLEPVLAEVRVLEPVLAEVQVLEPVLAGVQVPEPVLEPGSGSDHHRRPATKELPAAL